MPLNTEWNPSDPLTVGLEWELQILDRETLKPKNAYPEIVADVREELRPLLHKEIYKSMLEIVTPPAESEESIVSSLETIFSDLRTSAVKRNYHLVGLGTLYTQSGELPEKNLTPRYKRFIRQFGELLDDFYIYGIHIHVGFPDPEWAVKAYNNFVAFAPLLLALAANSLYYRGVNTKIHSFRTVVFERLPRAELPPQFDDYGLYEEHMQELYLAGAIETVKDVWYHVRLRPDFGTVEVRVFDSGWDLQRIGLYIKLVRAIAKFSKTYGYRKVKPHLIKQSWWLAKRYSLDADYLWSAEDRRPLRQVGFELIYLLDELGIFKKLGYDREEFLKALRRPSPARDIEAKVKVFKGPEKIVKMAAII